jgi:glycosyltransferase involved in cell wall biosynthesis
MATSKKPLTLSIIIPAYNEARHLRACLDAIAKQTEMPDEVIVVDNNSSDETEALAKSYPFVRVLTEKKQGVVHARNTGFNAATTDLIGRIDADTILPEGWVHYVKRFYSDPEHYEHTLTGGAYFYNIRFPHLAGWFQGQIAFRVNRLLLGHYITFGSNMALPHTVWAKVKEVTCKTTDIHEDLDLAIHLHRLGYVITYREHLRVGVKMRRVLSDRHELWDNLMWWPRTLRRHGKKTWVLGWIGALLMYIASPLGPLLEKLARIFGGQPHV